MTPRHHRAPDPHQAGGKSRKRPDQDAWQRLTAMKPMGGDRHE